MDWCSLVTKLASSLGLGEKLFEWLMSKAESQVALLGGVEDGIEKLQRTSLRIQSLLVDAEERRHIEDEHVKRWLLDLKAVAFDADDLLDRYQTLRALCRLASGADSRKRKHSWLDLGLRERRSFGTDIAKLEERLKEIAAARRNLQQRPSDGRTPGEDSGELIPRPAAASCDGSRVVGRDEQFKSIVDALTSECQMDLPVIAIYGVAGIGKTTLAQLVFDHFEKDKNAGEGTSRNPKPRRDRKGIKPVTVDDNPFDLKIWVSLTKGCDVVMATREIIEAITKTGCEHLSLNNLHHRLRELLKGQKFLLVLDNYWTEDYRFWETLCPPLLTGATGSKVLITTQSEVVWRTMWIQLPLHLKGLNDNDCWTLLRDLAFQHSEVAVDPNLEDIGRQIVKRCQGSPLAAKSLGATLCNETNIDAWENILREMWVVRENNNEILVSLQISYHQLTFQLKQCFAYCSVFPNGHEFYKDELVQMWIAEGLIERNGIRSLEIIGGRYFDCLLWRSFFETSSKDKQKYRMPSLYHDLARLVSNNELLIIEDNVLHASPRQPRYALLLHQKQDQESFKNLYQYKCLRTLKLHCQCRIGVGEVPEDLFHKLKCLRLLDLSNSDIEELPESIGDLIHLRYLGLTGTNIEELPDAVSNLYNLQTLELSQCKMLLALPEGTSKLVNLRHLGLHLDWENIDDLISMPPGMDRLTSLQTLSRFTVTTKGGRNIVDCLTSLQTLSRSILSTKGECNIGELKELNLRGEVCISKLEKIVDVSDGKAANLMGKKYIDKLMLRWTDQANVEHSFLNRVANFMGKKCIDKLMLGWTQGVDTCEEVTESLRPHTNLKNLWILNYPGKRYPKWLEDPAFSNLKMVRLSGCGECEVFPSLWRLPRLKNLHIEKMNRLRTLGDNMNFPSLETLTLKCMPSLEKLFAEVPMLRELFILCCPKLSELMNLPLTTVVTRD